MHLFCKLCFKFPYLMQHQCFFSWQYCTNYNMQLYAVIIPYKHVLQAFHCLIAEMSIIVQILGVLCLRVHTAIIEKGKLMMKLVCSCQEKKGEGSFNTSSWLRTQPQMRQGQVNSSQHGPTPVSSSTREANACRAKRMSD